MASVSRSAQPTLPSKGNGHTPDFMEQLIKTPSLILTEPAMQTLHVNGYDMAYLSHEGRGKIGLKVFDAYARPSSLCGRKHDRLQRHAAGIDAEFMTKRL